MDIKLMKKAISRIKDDPNYMSYVLHKYYGSEVSPSKVGCQEEEYIRLSLCKRPLQDLPKYDCDLNSLSELSNVAPEKLNELIHAVSILEKLDASSSNQLGNHLLAARPDYSKGSFPDNSEND